MLSVVVVAIIEFILWSTWNTAYYSSGFCILKQKHDLPVNWQLPAKMPITIGSKGWFSFEPSIIINKLKNEQYALREILFDYSFIKLRYSPVVRCNIVFESSSNRLIVRYFLNYYYPLFFLGIAAGIVMAELEHGRALSNSILPFTIMSIVVALFTVFLITVQMKVYEKPIKRVFLDGMKEIAKHL